MKSGASESSYYFLEEYYKFPENIIVSHLPQQQLQQQIQPPQQQIQPPLQQQLLQQIQPPLLQQQIQPPPQQQLQQQIQPPPLQQLQQQIQPPPQPQPQQQIQPPPQQQLLQQIQPPLLQQQITEMGRFVFLCMVKKKLSYIYANHIRLNSTMFFPSNLRKPRASKYSTNILKHLRNAAIAG